MRRFDILLYVFLFGYLISGWTGFWSPQIDQIDDSKLTVSFEPGFLATLSLEHRFLDDLQDPLIESDSRPDRLFEAVHRSYTQHIVLAVMFGFLLIFLTFTILAGVSKRWFYAKMKRMLCSVVTVFLLLNLLLSPKTSTAGLIVFSDQLLFYSPIFFKSLLLFLATAGWMWSETDDESNRPFLSYLKADPLNARHLFKEKVLPASVELIAITLLAAIITNFILLPLFQLQIHFAEYLVFLLVPGLLILAGYYVVSYRRVAILRNEEPSWSSSIGFLFFRMMRNVLVLTGSVAVVIAVLSVIFWLSYSNLNLLIDSGIVTEAPKL